MKLKRPRDRDLSVLRKGSITDIVSSLIHSVFLFSLLGCATQASMVDIELDQERVKLRQAEIEERLRVIEGSSQKRTTVVQQEQTGLVLKIDELATDLQTLQGSREESAYLTADLSQRLDDLAFRIKDLTGRLDILDREMVVVKESVGEIAQSLSLELRGKVPEETVSGMEEPPDNAIVLPGRSTGKDQTSGLSPSEAYGLAYNDYLKGNYDLALMGFKNFLEQFETTSLAPNAQYWIGESYYGKKDYLKAIEAFQKVIADYPGSNKAPGAILKSGYAYIELSDKDRAKANLKKVIENHPFSNEAELAKKRLAELN